MGSESGITAATKARPRLDAAAIFYICLGLVWTFILSGAMIYLWSKRRLPFLAIRCLPFSFAAVICLHLYWMLVQVCIVIGPIEPEVGEFWVMGTWLPWGVTLFHAANAQLLHVAKVQKRFINAGSVIDSDSLGEPAQTNATSKPWWKRCYHRFMQKSYMSRVLIILPILLVLQFLLTLLMYLISRKFHASWGIPGTEVHGTPMQQKVEQGRGWEWWPSVALQVFWAWVVAPVVLWRSRHIHDTHGWRLQTIACCISGLPAIPMWLIALNVPGMEPCNHYFIPPQWICVSVWFMEVFTIFLPIWQVRKQQYLQNETLEAIAQWETRVEKSDSMLEYDGFSAEASPVPDSFKKAPSCESAAIKELPRTSDDSSLERSYTMTALNHTLLHDPEPLRVFSALRDFSGENIAFLTSVASWVALWPSHLSEELQPTASNEDPLPQLSRRALFKHAICIYARFVSQAHADVPINIAGLHRERLDEMFGAAARVLYGEGEDASFEITPFESPSGGLAEKVVTKVDTRLDDMIAERVEWWGKVPDEFSINVFRDAVRSVKYLVLTNTWPKFVKEMMEIRVREEQPIKQRTLWRYFG